MIRCAGVLVCAVALAGCAASELVSTPEPPPRLAQGVVGATLIAPAAGTRRMEPVRNRRFIHPNLESPAPLPVYPPALLPQRLEPIVVCVDAVIGVAGAVTATAPRLDGECALRADVDTTAFVDAALAAIRAWTYAPALLCVAPDNFEGEDACSADDVVETPTAVRLSYAFRFSQTDGTPDVERVGAP